MRVKLLIVAALAVAVCGLCGAGCKKSKGPGVLDPHSAEGVMLRLQEQGRLLNQALVRKDFPYIHDYAYYFTGLAQALFSKLNDEQKQRLRGSFDELVGLSNQLDRAAGGRHSEATEVTMQRLQAVLKDIDTQFQSMKKAR
jgi:hypothetical protein